MANNSTRKSIEFLVEGALPPHSTNVLWMDTSNPELPVLKIFKNGVWTPVTTDNNKTIQLLVEHITSLQEEITNLEEGVQATCDSIAGKVDAIILDLSGLATEANATANKTAILDSIEAAKVALQGGDTTATLAALKTAIDNIDIDTTALAKQGANTSATLTATQAAVVDGNDTAISVSKEIRSEVGTGSDTAAEIGTVFSILKWVKDKVKSIYSSITDNTSGLVAIKNAIEDNAGIPMVTVPNTTAAQELTPNVVYVFSTRSSALTLTLGAGEVGQVNDYHFFIVTDTTAPTITWPAGITWNGGNAPTIAGDKTYEIDILNNVAVYLEI